jgi:alpha-1,2-glucosyltransferase
MLAAICISCHPLIYFFTFLYYTDVGSLFFAMISLTTHVYHHYLWSAMFSLIALTFRQTNIIIVAYEIGLTIIEEFRLKTKQSHILHVYTSRSSDTIETKEYLIVLWKYGRLEILFFIFFIKNNYSMTLGHQEHHQIVLHLAQMHYYAIYTAFFVSAHLVSLLLLFIKMKFHKKAKRQIIFDSYSMKSDRNFYQLKRKVLR